jgi:hypothetical protein
MRGIKIVFAKPHRSEDSDIRIAILQGVNQRLLRPNAAPGKLLSGRRRLRVMFRDDLWRGARKPGAA